MNTARSVRSVLGFAAFLAALSACGGGANPASPSLEISPASPQISPGSTMQFTATAPADETVTWSVAEPDGGVIDANGVYTAPDTEGTYTVTAASASAKQATQVRVRQVGNISVDVSPHSATLAAGESLTLTATVSGSASGSGVTWSVAQGAAGGTVTAAGVYTAPQAGGTFTVVATSTADASRSDRATITVTAPPPPPPPPPPSSGTDLGACTALVSDGTARSAPSLALPSYSASAPNSTSIKDPVFGTRITRVTGTPGDAIAGTGAIWRTDKPYAGPVYAKDPPWNADQSLLAIKAGVAGQTLFLDGNTYVPLYVRSNLMPEYRWHPTDPRYMVYVDASGKAGLFEPATDRYTQKFDPGSGLTNCTLGQYEGNVSYDGRWVVITCNASGVTGEASYVFFAADLETGTKYPTIRAIDLGFSGANTNSGSPLDWASISPRGDYIVATQDWQQQRALTLDGSEVSRWGGMGHYDLGIDTSGNEVAYSSGGPDVWKLSDGSGYTLPWGGADQFHSSTRNNLSRGWGYGTLEISGGAQVGEIVAHELTPGGRIRRLAHHRTTSATYDHQAFAAVSPDGKRVLFRSDWGDSSGPGYGFVLDLRELCP